MLREDVFKWWMVKTEKLNDTTLPVYVTPLDVSVLPNKI